MSAEELKRVTGVSAKQYKKVPWHSTELLIKQLITPKEYIEMIHNILNDCQTPDGNVAFEMVDFAIRVNTIAAYAFVDLPKDPNDLYYIVYASNLYDTICKYANKGQIESISKTIAMYAGNVGE